jgi:dimethylargininase
VLVAVTRPVSASIARCELTHLSREPIDLERAREQHRVYEQTLQAAAHCEVLHAASAPDLPDAVFVEDTALVLDEIGVMTRLGAASRRAETAGVADVLGRYRELRYIEAPGTIDGGDVVVAGRRVFIGRSSRTNDAGIEQVRRILQPFGYDVTAVEFRGCLHLKSAATLVSDGQLLVNPAWIPAGAIRGVELLEIDPREPYAANILKAGGGYIYSSAFPRTADLLQRSGLQLNMIDMSELAKAEGAVTCCSLIFRSSSSSTKS